MDRLNKVAAVSLVTFSAVLAAFVGSRVDQFTASLLFSMCVILLIVIPLMLLAFIIFFIFFRQRDDAGRERYDRLRHTHMPPNPPQYWVMPTPTDAHYDVRAPLQPAPYLRAPDAMPEYVMPTARRRFYLIGESGEAQEIVAPLEAGDAGDDLPDDPARF
ncbi:MAG: hypothetical protein ACK4JD_01625 [Thermoflexales bacterium]